MAGLGPVARHDLIDRLRKLGFTGPYSGGRHEFMMRGSSRVFIPNPHRSDIGVQLLKRMLDQAGVTPAEWDATR